MTSAERRALNARAHALRPVVMVGHDGLTTAVLHEIDRNLRSHELIKIRVLGDSRAARAAMLTKICDALVANAVQHIGKIFVVFRPHPEDENAAPAPTKKPRRRQQRRVKRSFQR